jgi:hypothetical protein
VGDVVAAKRPRGVRRDKRRIDLYLSDEAVRRLGCAAGLHRVSPSEVADDILLRLLPEVPPEYVAAVASIAS